MPSAAQRARFEGYRGIGIAGTAGGPGGATDSVTSFIFREYRDRSNVGYGTMLAMIYLVFIVICFTGFMKAVSRWMRPQY